MKEIDIINEFYETSEYDDNTEFLKRISDIVKTDMLRYKRRLDIEEDLNEN